MAPRLFPVAAGADVGRCKHQACGKEIFWGRTAKGTPIPMDCNVPGGKAPTRTSDGLGQSHFETCEHAQHFRRNEPAARPSASRTPKAPKVEQSDLFSNKAHD